MLSFVRRAGALVVSLGLVALPLVVIGAAPAQADPSHQCTGQDRVILKRVERVSKHFVATHVEAITLAAGTAFTQSEKLEWADTLKAKTNITSEVGGSANWGFASLDAKVSVSLAAEGAHTTKRSVTKTFSIPPKNHARRFVLFTGNYLAKGRWHYLSCSRAPGHGTEKYGPIQSFGGTDTGTVLCPHSRYKVTDYRYRVALKGGC